jgi:O-antigen ligase
MQVDPWKFALGPAITGALFLFYKFGNPFRGTSLFLILLIVIDVYLGSRSLALFTILALVITSRKDRIAKISLVRYLAGGLIFITLLFGVERIYYQLSTNGTFGISQQLKSLDQYKAGPVLLTGRSEFAFEVSAIIQNPLLGTGSSPGLTYEILNRAQEINSSLGVKTEFTNAYKSTLQDGKVPQHSMLFGAWVEGGILSFTFWAILFIWTARRFIVMPKRLPPLGHFTTYAALSTLWAIVFSPLGAGSRMELVIGLVALLLQSKIGDNAYPN